MTVEYVTFELFGDKPEDEDDCTIKERLDDIEDGLKQTFGEIFQRLDRMAADIQIIRAKVRGQGLA